MQIWSYRISWVHRPAWMPAHQVNYCHWHRICHLVRVKWGRKVVFPRQPPQAIFWIPSISRVNINLTVESASNWITVHFVHLLSFQSRQRIWIWAPMKRTPAVCRVCRRFSHRKTSMSRWTWQTQTKVYVLEFTSAQNNWKSIFLFFYLQKESASSYYTCHSSVGNRTSSCDCSRQMNSSLTYRDMVRNRNCNCARDKENTSQTGFDSEKIRNMVLDSLFVGISLCCSSDAFDVIVRFGFYRDFRWNTSRKRKIRVCRVVKAIPAQTRTANCRPSKRRRIYRTIISKMITAVRVRIYRRGT